MLTNVYRDDQPRFGPFYDDARPFHKLTSVRRRAGYVTNATLDRAAFLAAFGRTASAPAPAPASASASASASAGAGGDYVFYSGDQGTRMYFVKRGTAEVLDKNGKV